MTAYGKLDYWDERYRKPVATELEETLSKMSRMGDAEPFDWFQRYAALKPILLECGLEPESKILNLGCGTSRVCEDLYADGYKKIVNVDYSAVCISHMQKRCADKEEMTFLQMNTLDMNQLDDNDFDLIFDKGTLDCILCGDNSFDNIQKMLREVSRILAPGGTYIVVSYGQPNFRLSHLQKEEFKWTVAMKTIQKPSINIQAPIDEKDNVHYIYICKKAGNEETSQGGEGGAAPSSSSSAPEPSADK